MFKTAAKPSYTVTVEVMLPGENKQTFDVEVRRQSQAEITAMWEKVNTEKWKDGDVIRDVVIGWSGVRDDNGELEFSTTNLAKLLDIHPVERCIIAAYLATITGARQKN